MKDNNFVPHIEEDETAHSPPNWYNIIGSTTAIIVAIGTIIGIFLSLGLFAPHISSGSSPGASSATAHPTPVPPSNVLYQAHIPGPGCDKGGGLWNNPNSHGTTSLSCLQTGMELTSTNPGDFDDVAEAFFSWPQHPFPATYSLQANISLLPTSGVTCAGFSTHRSSDPQGTHQGGYLFTFCSDASWQVDEISDADSGTTNELSQGCTDTSPCFALGKVNQLQVQVVGKTQTFLINGTIMATITDSTFPSTNQISLYVWGHSVKGSQCSAIFSDFVYAPKGS